MLGRVWYLPERIPTLRPRDMRCLHFWMLSITIFPGIPIAIVLRNSVAWVVLVSMVTWSATHLAGWSAERPSEVREGEA